MRRGRVVVCFLAGWGMGLAATAAPGGSKAARRDPPTGPPPPTTQPGQVLALTHRDLLRYQVCWRPMACGTAAKHAEAPVDGGPLRWVRCDYSFPTPLPEDGWSAADFDDSSWSRRAGPILGYLGYVRGDMAALNDAALLCVRARFGVPDPAGARGLVLRLSYRGGAVAYLNGAEIARGHLPAGPIKLLTPAEDYPAEMFSLPPAPNDQPPKGREAEYLKRVREMSVELPAGRLRRGTNVLALELHRTAVPTDEPAGRGIWAPVGLVSLALIAPREAGIQSPGPGDGTQLWNADTLVRPGVEEDYGDRLEPLRPITMTAPRNSIINGQVAVGLPADGAGPTAVAGDLKSAAGAVIPARAVRVRYVQPGEAVPMLLDAPAKTGAVHPIWLTVSVPADAPAGTYRGTLTVATSPVPTAVPVELTVVNWTLPDPAAWVTAANLLQSPESVAAHYKVPLWSEEHFRRLDKSLALMGYAGNNCLSIGALAEDIFGADPAVVFVDSGQAWRPDLRFARRYLSLYAAHAPPPRALSLQVWNYSVSGTGARRDSRGGKWQAEKIKVLQLRDGKLAPAEMPGYGRPGTEETWREVLTALRAEIDKLGWRKTEIMLGTSGDDWPVDEIVAFFKKISPAARWRVATHGGSVSRWGAGDEDRRQANGMVVGWANMVRRHIWRRGPGDAVLTVIKRDGARESLMDYYSLPPLCRQAQYEGFCFRPLDYWTYTTPERKSRCALSSYVSFGNITPHGPRAIVLPGPDGPTATPHLEMLREGMQLSETVAFIRRVTTDARKRTAVGEALATQAENTIQGLMDVMESSRRMTPNGGGDTRRLITRVYLLAARIAEKAGEK